MQLRLSSWRGAGGGGGGGGGRIMRMYRLPMYSEHV